MSTTMRAILPKEEQDDSSPSLSSIPESRASKRRCVSSACIPCRKRKSKCDGSLPFCSTCIAVYHTDCAYDVESDHRRKATQKRGLESLKDRSGALGVIVASIRTSTESEVADIIQQIRADENLEALADSLSRNVPLPSHPNAGILEGDFSDYVGTPAMDYSGVIKHFGPISGLGLVKHVAKVPIRTPRRLEGWTNITSDPSLISHLLGLYFSWQHPFYVLLSKECFLHDMTKGYNKYCSPLLVNSMFALACGCSDRWEARTDSSDPHTAGDHFFAEARRLLYEDESSSLTTVQALAIMGIREACCGRESSGFQYAGRCTRMALELGLHLSFTSSSDLSPTELEVRKITFWGCFTLDTAWSISLGRISQLPRAAISLDKPTIVPQLEAQPWRPFIDTEVLGSPMEQPSHTHTVLIQFSLLSEIVNDTVFMFYAPRERFTSKKLLDFYSRYKRWYAALPTCLGVTSNETPLPQVLLLHMLYHNVVLHLFRPFLKVDLTESSVSPRQICTSSAESITLLAGQYRKIYSMRRICLIITHVLLSSNIIHLLNLPKPSACRDLIDDMTAMREVSQHYAFAGRAFSVIVALSKQWGINLPAEVSQPSTEKVLHIPQPSNHFPSQFQPQEVESTQTNSTGVLPASWPIVDLDGQRQFPKRYSYSEIIIPSVTNARSKSPANPTDLFWSPFPDQGFPLQATQERGPMDITAMLDIRNNDWDQFNRDGFKIANMNDPVLGFSTTFDDWT